MGSIILSLGHYAPERRVMNAELEVRMGLEPGWIEKRTGIKERRFAADGEALTDLAVKAGQMALARSGVPARKISLVLLATSTPDHLLPPSAPLVVQRLGLPDAGGIDLVGACSGFLYAFTLADSFVRTHGKAVLVIAANILSRRIDFSDPASASLFSDAAGAVLLGPSERKGAGILGMHLAASGEDYDLIQIPVGGSREPYSETTNIAETKMKIRDGKAVFTKAVDLMASSAARALSDAACPISGVDHWIAHQANARVVTAVQRKLGLSDEKVMSSYALYANSSAATIPLTLSLAASERSFKSGDKLLLTAAGAGLLGGAVLFGF